MVKSLITLQGRYEVRERLGLLIPNPRLVLGNRQNRIVRSPNPNARCNDLGNILRCGVPNTYIFCGNTYSYKFDTRIMNICGQFIEGTR